MKVTLDRGRRNPCGYCGSSVRLKMVRVRQRSHPMEEGSSCPACTSELLYDDTTDTVYCAVNPDHYRRKGEEDDEGGEA